MPFSTSYALGISLGHGEGYALAPCFVALADGEHLFWDTHVEEKRYKKQLTGYLSDHTFLQTHSHSSIMKLTITLLPLLLAVPSFAIDTRMLVSLPSCVSAQDWQST